MASTPWPKRSSESSPGPRVAGVDPGTVSIDVCALDGGEVLLDQSFRSADLALDPAPLVDALVAQGPFDLVLGPAGYGLPLVPGERVGERELALMLLLRSDQARRARRHRGHARDDPRADRRRAATGLRPGSDPPAHRPGPPQVESHRPRHRRQGLQRGPVHRRSGRSAWPGLRADLVHHARARRRVSAPRWRSTAGRSSTGSAALAPRSGRAPAGRSTRRRPTCWARRSRRRPSSAAGRWTRAGSSTFRRPARSRRCADDPRHREGWLALEEGGGEGCARTDGVGPRAARDPRRRAPRGRLRPAWTRWPSGSPGWRPVSAAIGLGSRAKTAAQGAALLADGLAGGRYAPLVERLRLREASGTALDHLRVARRRDDPPGLAI